MEAPITIAELMLDASRADTMEAIHQRVCRQRARMETCQRCLDLEAEVLATDRALRGFFQSLADAS